MLSKTVIGIAKEDLRKGSAIVMEFTKEGTFFRNAIKEDVNKKGERKMAKTKAMKPKKACTGKKK